MVELVVYLIGVPVVIVAIRLATRRFLPDLSEDRGRELAVFFGLLWPMILPLLILSIPVGGVVFGLIWTLKRIGL